jgi:hypothetical protein
MSEQVYIDREKRRESQQRKMWRAQFANTALRQLLAVQPFTLGAEDLAHHSVTIADAMLTELEKNNE